MNNPEQSQTIHLPFGIEIEVGPVKPGETHRTGSISSTLKEGDNLGDDTQDAQWDAAVDAIETFLLALACEGVDMTAPAIVAAVEGSIEAISNRIG